MRCSGVLVENCVGKNGILKHFQIMVMQRPSNDPREVFEKRTRFCEVILKVSDVATFQAKNCVEKKKEF